MVKQKRILVCPLDWGLGHATRCIPLIRQLLWANVKVIIAADKRPLALLQQEFPQLPFIVLPGYGIVYPQKGSMVLKMAGNLPNLIKGIRAEHRALQRLIEQYDIDAVISDSRFGLWSNKLPCVFITHQITIKAPFGEKLLYWLTKSIIHKYTACWVPDTTSCLLSGELSSKYKLPINSTFIGPLSRFTASEKKAASDAVSILGLVSGPEPQRSIFEQLLVAQLTPLKIKALIVQGMPEQAQQLRERQTEYLETVSHLQTSDMQAAIANASLVICRSGYSTIMDLATLGKKALFIPTPGQTEQEYLAAYFMQQKIAFAQTQKKMDLPTALKASENYTGFERINNGLYKSVVDKWVRALGN